MPKELNTTQGRIVCERSANHYKKDSVRQELRGQEAEKLAYLELKKQYPNIIWHSKNSEVPSDRNRAPRDVSCDMWVDGEEKRYFEVKAYGDRFYMSKREYESMYINREEYEVVLANTDKATISRHAFDEIDKLKTIESYCFYFKIDEEK